jgi:hypothetical protein
MKQRNGADWTEDVNICMYRRQTLVTGGDTKLKSEKIGKM